MDREISKWKGIPTFSWAVLNERKGSLLEVVLENRCAGHFPKPFGLQDFDDLILTVYVTCTHTNPYWNYFS